MSYKVLTQYYDEIHADLTEDIDFLLATASGNVLEVGCGSGRLLLPFAEAGFTITGIDNSAEMLALAKEKLAESATGAQNKVTLINADAVEFALDEQFDTVIVPYNTLLHFGRGDLSAVFQNIRTHLAPNGTLIIDTLNPVVLADLPTTKANSTSELERTFANGTQQLSRVWHDAEAQQYWVEWAFINETKTVVEERYHYVQVDELVDLLKSADLKTRMISGNYNAAPFDPFSKRLIIRAKLALSQNL